MILRAQAVPHEPSTHMFRLVTQYIPAERKKNYIRLTTCHEGLGEKQQRQKVVEENHHTNITQTVV